MTDVEFFLLVKVNCFNVLVGYTFENGKFGIAYNPMGMGIRSQLGNKVEKLEFKYVIVISNVNSVKNSTVFLCTHEAD